MTAPIVTIAGAKGGVGKTTTSINLASAIAGPERTVAVVEMDLAMANFVDFLSIPSGAADPTLHDVLAGDAEPFDAVYPFGDHVAAVPSGTTLDGYARADMDEFPRVLKRYALKFDVVVVDTGAGLSRLVVDPIGLADGAVVVSTPRVAAVRDADKTVKLSKRVGTPVFGLVLTQSGTGASPGPERISEFLGVDLLGHVPDDEAVPNSQDQGVPVVTRSPESPAGSTYRDIADNVLFALSTHSDGSPIDEDFEAPDRVTDEGAAAPAVDGGSATQLADEEPADAGDDYAPDDAETEDDGSEMAPPEESDEATDEGVARAAEAAEGETDSPSVEADESETDDETETESEYRHSVAQPGDTNPADSTDSADSTDQEGGGDDTSGDVKETAETDGTESVTADDQADETVDDEQDDTGNDEREEAGDDELDDTGNDEQDEAVDEPSVPADAETDAPGLDDPDEEGDATAEAADTETAGGEPDSRGDSTSEDAVSDHTDAVSRPGPGRDGPERPGHESAGEPAETGDRTNGAQAPATDAAEESADEQPAETGPATESDPVGEPTDEQPGDDTPAAGGDATDESADEGPAEEESETETDGFVGRLRAFLS
ncbi:MULTISPECIES: P-loop NTPase [Salinibaculum]|uniref:P-loop NTPase n=1 Tax=Salinibaculum TaxID=2732368 RepID=UPI0030D53B6E